MAVPEHTAQDVAASASTPRLRYIDALRGIAALLVLWLHVANSYHALSPQTAAQAHWLNDFISQIDIGRIGVVVFFLISGFVIPFSIKPHGAAPVAGFAIRRFFRIYPAYWLSVPLAAFVFFWWPGLPFGGGEFLINLTLLQDLFGVRHAEGVYWTLLVELAFYALCIVLLLTRSLFSPRRIAALCAALALLHTSLMFMQWLGRPIVSVAVAFWPLHLSVMLWGTLYRLRAGGETRGDNLAGIALWALGAFYIVVLPLAATLAIQRMPNYTYPYAIAFVVFLLGTSVLRIETRLTDWLGRISYSVYLFHPIVFQPVLIWLLLQPTDSAWRTQHLSVYLAAILVLTLLAASLAFRFVEQPAIRLGHRLAARREGRTRSRPTAQVTAASAEHAAS
jgi:peptidoglycan/LPS O-acetylase OafA/YrhL